MPLSPENNRPHHGKRCRSCWGRRSVELAKTNGTHGKWRREHPEIVREKLRVWLKSNPHARAVYIGRYRAKFGHVRSAGDLTATQWRDRLEEFNHACAYCLRRDVQLTQDHMQPIKLGGLHTLDNVIPACRSCNSRKGARGIMSMVRLSVNRSRLDVP